MRARSLFFLLTAAGAAFAQVAGPATDASVSGVVKDSVTGEPLANYNVSTEVNVTWTGDTVVQGNTTRDVVSVTDAQGHYQLMGLPPATYRIEARSSETFGPSVTRRITVAGHNLENIDFRIELPGTISGRVIDENMEPVPGINVVLVAREYYRGELGYFFREMTRTDDRGQYTVARVKPGRAFLLMAEKRANRLTARSEVPLDPKLRRRAPVRTFYPNAPDMEGGSFLTLRPGEIREGVDIELQKAQSYCMEGTASGANGPGAMTFVIDGVQPAAGVSSNGGMMTSQPTARTGPDGKFRVCDLYPGVFRFTLMDRAPDFQDPNQAANRTTELITVGDHDLKNLRIATRPLAIDGEVALDGPAPLNPVPSRVNVVMEPLLRQQVPGERYGDRVDCPGTFTFAGLVPADYGLRVLATGKGRYVKDVTYAGNSILYGALHLGNAVQGETLRILVGQDGGKFEASVADKDGNPMAQVHIIAVPADIASEAALQAAMAQGETDQAGRYQSSTLAPGKYYVCATFDDVNATPESIARLWRARPLFSEMEIPPNGSPQVTLIPIALK